MTYEQIDGWTSDASRLAEYFQKNLMRLPSEEEVKKFHNLYYGTFKNRGAAAESTRTEMEWNHKTNGTWTSKCGSYSISVADDGVFECRYKGLLFRNLATRLVDAKDQCDLHLNSISAHDRIANLEAETRKLLEENRSLRSLRDAALARDRQASGPLQKVIDHVIRERQYADIRWGNPNDLRDEIVPTSKSVGEYIALMYTEIAIAGSEWRGRATDEGALKCVRNIAQFAVACLEQNGLPPERPASVVNARNGRTYQMPAKG